MIRPEHSLLILKVIVLCDYACEVSFPVTSHADELREGMVPQMDILATKKRK
jgi:hypothetical protein